MKTPETVAWGCACSEPISNDDAGGPLECFECKQITEPLIRRADVIANRDRAEVARKAVMQNRGRRRFIIISVSKGC